MAKKHQAQTLRIIGGEWRSRLFTFPEQADVRPTHDRLRETLFNWLDRDVMGARCLDLFAGSGALGFEALSRGAQKCVFVDADQKVVTALKQTAQVFDANDRVDVLCGKLPEMAFRSTEPYDIIFLDPPYETGLIVPSLQWLHDQQLLHDDTLIYIESEKQLDFETLPNVQVLKEKKTKSVKYGLIAASTY